MHLTVLRTLLYVRVTVNINTIDWAALNGWCEVLSLLLEFKADPNVKNEFDQIPLEEALKNGFVEAAVSPLTFKCSHIGTIGKGI